MITALAGGVGAAKFLAGLTQSTSEAVTVIGNTADDFRLYGLHICPDLDTVTYTLAGMVGEAGWGIAGDTTRALDQLASLGFDTWFSLRDQDLGTHLARTQWLSEGLTLGAVAERIRTGLGVAARILPMTNDSVGTKILTTGGQVRDFQEYFVKLGFSDEVAAVSFEGVDQASPAPGVIEAIEQAGRIIVCPSNPVLSIGPILAVPGIRKALTQRRADVAAVSPIIGGAALKGPAAALMPTVGAEATAAGVAELYRDFCATFVMDTQDAALAPQIASLDMKALVTDTVMTDRRAARRLAAEVIS
ncbi:MAG: 2-phospho-L-lactate transferase [Actinomycetota bacterium]